MQISPIPTVLLCITLVLAAAGPVWSQVLRENERGEKIVVYPDGRTEYYNGGPIDRPSGEASSQAYPVFDGYIEPLEGSTVPVTQEDLYKISLRRTQLASEAATIAIERANQARTNRENLEARLATASAAERTNLQRQLNAAREVEMATSRESIEAQQLLVRSRALTEKGGFVEAFNERQRSRRAGEALTTQQQRLADQPYASALPLADHYTHSASAPDVLRYPPPAGCRFALEGADPQTNQWRRDLSRRLLFTYTDERLRPYLRDKEYLRCEGFLTSLGGYRLLTLEFTFAYPNAREAYGFIEQGSVLTIKMLNGDFVNLRAGKMDRGSYDTNREILTYRIQYPIDRGQINLLRNGEVDYVRVFWSSGYEEYEVFQLDFFQQQFRCLGD